MALEPNIILQAGNFKTPDYAETMERRTAIQLRNAEIARANRNEQLAQAKAQRLGSIGTKAASGDLAGARAEATAAGDFDVLDHINKLEDAHRATIQRRVDAAAPLAFEASKLPYEQRKAFIAGQAQRLVANGWSPEELANFDPTDAALGSIVASAQTIKDMLDRQDKAADRTLRHEEAAATREFQRGNAYISAGLLPPDAGGAGGGATAPAAGGGGSRADRNNNPGNVRAMDPATGKTNPWVMKLPGYKGFDRGGYAIFADTAAGTGAQDALLGRYMANGRDSVSEIVNRWAPPRSRGGDNTDEQVRNYIDYVAKALNVNPNDTLTPAVIPRLRQAMYEFESGRRGNASAAGAARTTPGGLTPIPGGKLDKPRAAKMTPDEVRAEGLDPNVVYYRNADGVPQAVSGQDKKTAGGNLKPPPVAATKAYIDNRTSIRKLREAWTAVDQYPDAVGFTKGILPNAITSRTDPKGVDARAKVADIGSLLIHDRSGAAVTVAETPRLLPFVPQVGDTPQAVKTKLHNLRLALEGANNDIAEAYSAEQGYKFPTFRDGTLSARPGTRAPAAPAAPKVGTVQGGYRFKGGNPAAQSSWEKVK